MDFDENAQDPVYAQELTDRFSQHTGGVSHWDVQGLFSLLSEADPESAKIIPPENVKRVLRALEFYHATGEKISEHNEREKNKPSPYCTGYFVLNAERQLLYERIDRRVEKMLREGFEEEAKGLYERYGDRLSRTAKKALGYQELYAYFRGEYPYEEAIRLIKRNTRHFAKRQLTWFKRESDVITVEKADKSNEELTEEILRTWETICN